MGYPLKINAQSEWLAKVDVNTHFHQHEATTSPCLCWRNTVFWSERSEDLSNSAQMQTCVCVWVCQVFLFDDNSRSHGSIFLSEKKKCKNKNIFFCSISASCLGSKTLHTAPHRTAPRCGAVCGLIQVAFCCSSAVLDLQLHLCSFQQGCFPCKTSWSN